MVTQHIRRRRFQVELIRQRGTLVQIGTAVIIIRFLLPPMSISKRLSIAWGGSAPYEDTDTLVLTGRTYFVDVRVKKGSDPLTLDWAIAGTRTSTPGTKPGR